MQIFGLKNKILGFFANRFRNFAELLETRISLDKASSSEQENNNDTPNALEDWLERTASVRKEEWMGFNKENLLTLATDVKEEIDQTHFDKQPNLDQQKLDLLQLKESESPTFEKKNNLSNVFKRNKNETRSKEKRIDTKSVSIQKKSNLPKLQGVAKSTRVSGKKSDNPAFVSRDKQAIDSKFVPINKRKQDLKKVRFSLIKTKDNKPQENPFESKIPVRPKRKNNVDFKLQPSITRREPNESGQLDSFKKTGKNNTEYSRIKSSRVADRKIETSFETKTFNEKKHSDKTPVEYKIFNEKTYSSESPSIFSKHKTSDSRSNKLEIEEIGKTRNVEEFQKLDSRQVFQPKNSASEDLRLSTLSKKNDAKIYENKFRTFNQNTRKNNEYNSDYKFEINDSKWIELPEQFGDNVISELERIQLDRQQLQALESEQIG